MIKSVPTMVLATFIALVARRAGAQVPPKATAQIPAEQLETTQGFGAVGVESLDDLRSLILEGPEEQVRMLEAVIDEIDRLSVGGDAEIRIVTLEHADAESMAALLTRVYAARDQGRPATETNRARVGFVPMAQPNAVIVIARGDQVEEVIDFARELDGESGRSGAAFKVFPLRQASAVNVRAKLVQFFTERDEGAGLRVRIEVVADERTNSLLVFAGPADLAQAESLIKQLDGDTTSAVNDLRIFRLKNALATELAALLQQAIVTRGLAAGGGTSGLGTPGLAGPGGAGAAGQPVPGANMGAGATGQQRLAGVLKSARLRFLATDDDGKPIESGILEDITVSADERSNSLIVTAPASSMSLVAELIAKLDAMPNPAAELKVFTLRNSDAESMVNTLSQIFQPAGGAGGQGADVQTVAFSVANQPVELSRVGLNFSTDVRTNSVIASGTKNDLLAVEAMILRLDASNVRERKTLVYKLRNLTALEAANALNNFLSSQDVIAEGQEGRISFAEQISREVSVVPEEISNSLLISSTPRFFDEILRIVEEIDMRPPQVVIQVLIAEVQLADDEDLGLELGTQSSVLYDRSLQVRNTAINAQQNSLDPGFNFNTTQPLRSPVGAEASEVGLQGLTNFALNRANSTLGYGGLLFAASSDNVSILLRALKRQRRLDVLSRPQIMTLDNQQAFIQIGQQVPTVTASQTTVQGSVVNSVEFRDVGIILQVTPRISPDGVVVMRVDPTVSSLDPSGGIPISSGGNNAAVLAPIINTTRAQTTVSTADGQTVVIGGLISKSKATEERKMPIVGDWPGVGWLFKTRFRTANKRELLLILTPRVVYSESDAELVKQAEAKRIDWILSDVESTHGDIGLPQPELAHAAQPTAEGGTPPEVLAEEIISEEGITESAPTVICVEDGAAAGVEPKEAAAAEDSVLVPSEPAPPVQTPDPPDGGEATSTPTSPPSSPPPPPEPENPKPEKSRDSKLGPEPIPAAPRASREASGASAGPGDRMVQAAARGEQRKFFIPKAKSKIGAPTAGGAGSSVIVTPIPTSTVPERAAGGASSLAKPPAEKPKAARKSSLKSPGWDLGGKPLKKLHEGFPKEEKAEPGGSVGQDQSAADARGERRRQLPWRPVYKAESGRESKP